MRRSPAPDTAPGPPPSGYITRAWGRDVRSGSVGPAPLWRVRFEGTRHGTTFAADGPFFDARVGHFYPSVQQAVLAWTGTPMLRDRESSAADVYEVLIADPRAYLADVRVLEDGYDVRVAGTLVDAGVPLHCAIVGTDVDGVDVERIASVTGGAATVRFRRLLRACTVLVLGEDGTTYDQHREDDLRALPGDSLFTGDGGARAARARDLGLVLESGGGEHVEFKAWIPKDPNDTKAVELLQSAVAFANAGGGTLFIGVSDQADVLGVERPLRREYGRDVGGDLARLRDAYYADVRQRLLTAIRPRVSVRLVWMDPAPEVWVLAVHVESGGREAHCVERIHESFVRRGATNRRASPEDVERMRRERAARGHRLPGPAAFGGLANLR